MTARPRIAASIRLVLAMMHLYAGVEANFGKALLDILRKQYPDQEVTESDAAVGNKLMMIARKQLQGNDTDAFDAIQKFLMYLTTGSTSADIDYDDDGKPIGKVWDFRKDWPTWQEALKAAYSNLRTTSMSNSMVKSRRKKNERSVDDAFGVRGEDGGAKSEGEARMPTPDDNALGKALDDHAAAHEFFTAIEDWIPDLKQTLSPEEKIVFESIMDDDIGSFGSDIKENMGHATFLKDKFQEQLPDVYKKHEKRWSGFVGDTKKKLLSKIEKFAEEELPESVYDTLYDAAGVHPKEAERIEKQKEKGKADYQKGIDERKVARLKAEYDESETSESRKKEIQDELDRLKKKGVDVDAVKPDASAGAAGKKNKKKEDKDKKESSSQASLFERVAARRVLSFHGF